MSDRKCGCCGAREWEACDIDCDAASKAWHPDPFGPNGQGPNPDEVEEGAADACEVCEAIFEPGDTGVCSHCDVGVQWERARIVAILRAYDWPASLDWRFSTDHPYDDGYADGGRDALERIADDIEGGK